MSYLYAQIHAYSFAPGCLVATVYRSGGIDTSPAERKHLIADKPFSIETPVENNQAPKLKDKKKYGTEKNGDKRSL